MYCKFGDKIVVFKHKIEMTLHFPETAAGKIRRGILSKDFLKRWESLKIQILYLFGEMLCLLNQMIREEENYYQDKKCKKRDPHFIEGRNPPYQRNFNAEETRDRQIKEALQRIDEEFPD